MSQEHNFAEVNKNDLKGQIVTQTNLTSSGYQGQEDIDTKGEKRKTNWEHSIAGSQYSGLILNISKDLLGPIYWYPRKSWIPFGNL